LIRCMRAFFPEANKEPPPYHESPPSNYHDLQSSCEDDMFFEELTGKAESFASAPSSTQLPIYQKLLTSLITGLPGTVAKGSCSCVQHLPQTRTGSLAFAISGLMRHVNAPVMYDQCCLYHNTALYLSVALGRVLSGPCKPMWTPISEGLSELCPRCGLLFSKHETCFFCNTVSDFSDTADRHVSEATSGPLLLSRERFTNLCFNMLRHIGTTDFTVALEVLLGAVVDMSTQMEWQEFWTKYPPCDGWACARCHGRNDDNMSSCCICSNDREPEVDVAESAMDESSELS